MSVRKGLAFAALLGLTAAPRAGADASLGADYTTGQGYRGYDAKGSYDLDPKGVDSLSAQYAYVHSTVGTPTVSNQVTVGQTHTVEDVWLFRSSLTAWKDNVSEVWYAGPSLDYNYTLKGERDDKILIVDFNTDLFYYMTGVARSSSTITQGRGKSAKTFVVPPGTGSVELFQLHPNLEFDVPLLNGVVTPSIGVGHYFYSKDPELIEQRAGQPIFAGSSAGMSSMVGGLFLNSGQLGVAVKLPWSLKLSGTLGVEQLATDHTWSTVQGVTLTDFPLDALKLSLGWNRSIQDGIAQDLYTAGLTVFF